MRKLKLQVQISIDGYIADKDGKTDWMIWNWGPEWTWDKALQLYFTELKSTVDCVLLSRKMAVEGFIDHWAHVAQQTENPQHLFAKRISDARKVVFSHTLDQSIWPNTQLAKGNLVEEVTKLKQQDGADIIAYGGASFVSSLIEAGLIDEFYLFVNPVALGDGMPIFSSRNALTLMHSKDYACGISVLQYADFPYQTKI
jgi:dihydrofolate reductase